MAEHVILLAGPVGAGKTTAVQSLSEIEVVRTEAANSDQESIDKPTTTVAFDYGEISLGPDEKIRLYGLPGQKRFAFMWQILKQRAVGMILLVPNDAPDPLSHMLEFLDHFDELCVKGGVVIAVTRTDLSPTPLLSEYYASIAAARPNLSIPVFTVDARDTEQLRIALLAVVMNVESHAAMAISVGGDA